MPGESVGYDQFYKPDRPTDLAIVAEKLPPVNTLRCAVIMISIIPIMCIYPFLQKYFAKGFLVGSVKG